MVTMKSAFSPAYVMDICPTDQGLRFRETNYINAAGFYGAEFNKIAAAIDGMTMKQLSAVSTAALSASRWLNGLAAERRSGFC